MSRLLLSKVRPMEICERVATFLRRMQPFRFYDPESMWVKGLTEIQLQQAREACFKMRIPWLRPRDSQLDYCVDRLDVETQQ